MHENCNGLQKYFRALLLFCFKKKRFVLLLERKSVRNWHKKDWGGKSTLINCYPDCSSTRDRQLNGVVLFRRYIKMLSWHSFCRNFTKLKFYFHKLALNLLCLSSSSFLSISYRLFLSYFIINCLNYIFHRQF